MKLNIGDEVTVGGTIVEITPSGNAVVKLAKGTRVLINPAEIKTIHPYKKPIKEDKRKGN
jgi:preprotein translocase subunit YajC